MGPHGHVLEDITWLLCDGLRITKKAPTESSEAQCDTFEEAAVVASVAQGLAAEELAVVDRFMPGECLPELLTAARALDARDTQETGFLDSVAVGLLEGRLPDEHPLCGQLPDALYGPAGSAPPGQEASCLARQAGGDVKRSWLAAEEDCLAGAFRRLTRRLDDLVASLQQGNVLGILEKRLSLARFRDNVMVAHHFGGVHEGSFELPYDTDVILRGRHTEWKGDGVLTAVFILCGMGGMKTHSGGRAREHNIPLYPGRLLLYWANVGERCSLLEASETLLAIVVRYFDGKRSLRAPPGMEHLYRHCNPVPPLDRLGALLTCAHDRNHARRLELIYEFFEKHGGDKLNPSALDSWLGKTGLCSQCGRLLQPGVVAVCPEFGGRWACVFCLKIYEQASCLSVRSNDGAAYSALAVGDLERQAVRRSMQDPAQWPMELRHSSALTTVTLAAPEELQGRACPLSALGECGDTTCVTYRFRTPGARPAFLRLAVQKIADAFGSGTKMRKRTVLSFLGAGQLYFEFLVLDALLSGGTQVLDVHLVDLSYGDTGKLAERAAIAQFIAWFSQVKTYVHTSVEEWVKRLSSGLGSETTAEAHAVVAVDASNIWGEWDSKLKPLLESVLPPGSLFLHLTQSRDEEAVRGKDGEEAPLFAWAEVYRLRLEGGRLAFQRLERRDWELGSEGPGSVTA